MNLKIKKCSLPSSEINSLFGIKTLEFNSFSIRFISNLTHKFNFKQIEFLFIYDSNKEK